MSQAVLSLGNNVRTHYERFSLAGGTVDAALYRPLKEGKEEDKNTLIALNLGFGIPLGPVFPSQNYQERLFESYQGLAPEVLAWESGFDVAVIAEPGASLGKWPKGLYNLDATDLGFDALNELVQRREYSYVNPVTHSLTTASKVPFFMTSEGRMHTRIEAQILDGMMVGLLTTGDDALKNNPSLRKMFALNMWLCDKVPKITEILEQLSWAHLDLYPLDSAFVHSKEGEMRDLPDYYGALSEVHLATAPFVLGLDGQDIASRMILNNTLDRMPLRVIPDGDQIFSPRLQKEVSLMYGANSSLHRVLNEVDSCDAQIEKTIFGEVILKGEGHRWTTAARPTLEYLGRLLGEQTRQGMEEYSVLSSEEIDELRSIG